jgi:iron(III) transport system ATP-binding protein
MGSMIEASGLVRRFGPVTAVDGVSLEIDQGEVVALLGPSGCGKTTLLRLLAGFERPDAGSVRLGGVEVAGRSWVPPERRQVGLVFQDYALFPHLTVAENVAFGLRRPGRSERVAELLAQAGLDAHGARYPHELSGGQQQRVAVARALAPRPRIVLLDEPWNTIDGHLREELRADVLDTLRAEGVTVVLVTHEREEAFSLADRIVLLHAGRVEQVGSAEELYYAPVSPWAARFIGDANFLPRTALGDDAAHAGVSCGDAGATVLVRPELVELVVDGDAPTGRVVQRQFRGHDVFYRVRLDDGTDIVCQRPSNELVGVHARVALRFHAAPSPVAV